MQNQMIIKNALINAFSTAVYVVLVATFMFNTSYIFGPDEPKTVLIPVVMLLLFVFSAGLTGALVFGKPIMWYLDGKKKEAMTLLGYTFAFLFIFAIIAFILTLLINA